MLLEICTVEYQITEGAPHREAPSVILPLVDAEATSFKLTTEVF